MPDFRFGIGNVLRLQSFIDGLPVFSAVVTAKRSRRRNRNEDAPWILGVQQNGMQAHSASARLPLRTGSMAAQSGEFFPGFSAVRRTEERRILNARINRIGIGQGWLQMP